MNLFIDRKFRPAIQSRSVSVALEIHVLRRLHETSIVERYTSWLAGDATCTEADKRTLQALCLKLSKYAHMKLVIRAVYKHYIDNLKLKVRTITLTNRGLASNMCADGGGSVCTRDIEEMRQNPSSTWQDDEERQ